MSSYPGKFHRHGMTLKYFKLIIITNLLSMKRFTLITPLYLEILNGNPNCFNLSSIDQVMPKKVFPICNDFVSNGSCFLKIE